MCLTHGSLMPWGNTIAAIDRSYLMLLLEQYKENDGKFFYSLLFQWNFKLYKHIPVVESMKMIPRESWSLKTVIECDSLLNGVTEESSGKFINLDNSSSFSLWFNLRRKTFTSEVKQPK